MPEQSEEAPSTESGRKPPFNIRNLEDLDQLEHDTTQTAEILILQGGRVYRVELARLTVRPSFNVQEDGEIVGRGIHTINVTGENATVTVVEGVATINIPARPPEGP